MANTLYCMDWIDGLKRVKSKSVDVIFTSPPYWGLKRYWDELGMFSEIVKVIYE